MNELIGFVVMFHYVKETQGKNHHEIAAMYGGAETRGVEAKVEVEAGNQEIVTPELKKRVSGSGSDETASSKL